MQWWCTSICTAFCCDGNASEALVRTPCRNMKFMIAIDIQNEWRCGRWSSKSGNCTYNSSRKENKLHSCWIITIIICRFSLNIFAFFQQLFQNWPISFRHRCMLLPPKSGSPQSHSRQNQMSQNENPLFNEKKNVIIIWKCVKSFRKSEISNAMKCVNGMRSKWRKSIFNESIKLYGIEHAVSF